VRPLDSVLAAPPFVLCNWVLFFTLCQSKRDVHRIARRKSDVLPDLCTLDHF
jgi:hypothetical protein